MLLMRQKADCNIYENLCSNPRPPGEDRRATAMEVESSEESAELKRLLEWELSLDHTDLRSHAWYHGPIPRQKAEGCVQKDGEFLVRDCSSKRGDYVLSCIWKRQPLHFVINKMVVQPETIYERIQYQFEEESFDSVSDLVTFYVGSGKPISHASGAKMKIPCNRNYPLSYYATKFGSAYSGQVFHGTLPRSCTPVYHTQSFRGGHYKSYQSPVHSPPRHRKGTLPRLPPKRCSTPDSDGTISPRSVLNGTEMDAKTLNSFVSNSSDGIIGSGPQPVHAQILVGNSKRTFNSLPRNYTVKQRSQSNTVITPMQVVEEPEEQEVADDLTPIMPPPRFLPQEDDKVLPENPPPKPSRTPQTKHKLIGSAKPQNDYTNDRVYSEIENESECKKTKRVNGEDISKEVVIEDGVKGAEANDKLDNDDPRHSGSYKSSGSDSGNASGDSIHGSDGNSDNAQRDQQISSDTRSSGFSEEDPVSEEAVAYTLPVEDPAPAFDLENFQTVLLPTFENKPLDAGALEAVLTRLTEKGGRVLANHLTRCNLELLKAHGDSDLGLGVNSGIELVTLPHGYQLRRDLIERSECLKLFVAATVLTCDEKERPELLHKWIQVAIEIKMALGDMYGFTAVMMGLSMPQVIRLKSTWHRLRQSYTDSAFKFEAKLRPILKAMDEGSDPLPPNMTIPHLLPLVKLLERPLVNETDDCLTFQWESSHQDFGLHTLFFLLEQARSWSRNINTFRRNSEVVLADYVIDDLLLDVFRTEFHQLFLFGSKGASAEPQERFSKFHQLLHLMSEKCESTTPT